jgi:uncharacterized HAD superfamily protein
MILEYIPEQQAGTWAVFDLDDTLCDLKDPLARILKEHTELDYHWEDWYDFSISKMYNLTHAEFCDLIIQSNILESLEPYKESAETLTELKKRGYNIGIITSRDYHPKAYKVTKTWFDKYGLPYDDIQISSHFRGKSEYAKIYEKVIVAVDDRIENCEDFINNGTTENVYLFDMPWNRSSSIKRINNIKDVLISI